MPTPNAAFAAVAAAISGIRPDDTAAVEAFYSTGIFALAEDAQVAIAEFLVAQTDMPTDQELFRLARKVHDLAGRPIAAA